MEKIGICTFYNNNNYGSYLQTFALEAVIGSMGYNAYLIDFNDIYQTLEQAVAK